MVVKFLVILIFIERVVVRVSCVRALVVVDAIIFSVVFKYISIYMLLFFYSVVYYISLLLLVILRWEKKASKDKTRSLWFVWKSEREREKEPSFFAFTLLHNFAWDNKIIAHTHTHTHTVSVRTIQHVLLLLTTKTKRERENTTFRTRRNKRNKNLSRDYKTIRHLRRRRRRRDFV